MSRAFVKEDDPTGGAAVLPDRRDQPAPESGHAARPAADRGAGSPSSSACWRRRPTTRCARRAARELRYWTARLGTARLEEPPASPANRPVRHDRHRHARGRPRGHLRHRRRGRGRAGGRPHRLDLAGGPGPARRRAGRGAPPAQGRARDRGDQVERRSRLGQPDGRREERQRWICGRGSPRRARGRMAWPGTCWATAISSRPRATPASASRRSTRPAPSSRRTSTPTRTSSSTCWRG